jgi:hypothetical protein
MADLQAVAARFVDQSGKFLLAIQTIKVVDAEAFARLKADAKAIAIALKDKPLVPKKLLWEIRAMAKILRAEAPYINKGHNDLNSMADEFEMTLDLILLGDTHENRQPGVPRVI